MSAPAAVQYPCAHRYRGIARGPAVRIIHFHDPAAAEPLPLGSHPAWSGKVIHLADVVNRNLAHAEARRNDLPAADSGGAKSGFRYYGEIASSQARVIFPD
jgi:hypothetical protein